MAGRGTDLQCQPASAVNRPLGYAVVDTETTGIHTGYRHRIAEIAIIHLDSTGMVTDEWSTLLNPDRDLGPQAIHGIRAAEVRRAPRFEHVAGDLIERFRGRIVVAHNWPFDAMHGARSSSGSAWTRHSTLLLVCARCGRPVWRCLAPVAR
jgi:DNA polymerase III epsilon subunit-like protein